MSIEIGSVNYSAKTSQSTASNSYKPADTELEKLAVTAEADGYAAAEAKPTEVSAKAYDAAGKTSHALDADTIKAMKDELEQRTQNLVQQMLGKQMDALTTSDESFWQNFRTGNFTATPEQIAQAQKDVADDGYWGVEQTSDRIVKYATALAGGDPDKLDTMIAAFEKGFKAATKTWGGELPSLAQRTRDAVLEKFDKLKKEYASSAVEK